MSGAVLSILAAIGHCFYSLSLKHSFRGRTLSTAALVFWMNLTVGILCLPGLAFSSLPFFDAAYLFHYIFPISALYLAGLMFMVLGFKHGPASISGPLLGTKIFFAAVASIFIVGEPLKPALWVAIVIALPAVALISYQHGEPFSLKSIFRASSLATLMAAALYGSCDGVAKVAINHFDKTLNIPGAKFAIFLHINILVAILSLSLVFFLKKDAGLRPDKKTLSVISRIAVIDVVVLMLFFYAVGATKNIAVVNVIFSSRTVLIIPMTYLLDKLLRHPMDGMAPGTFWMRLGGSMFLLGAIALALVSP